MDGLLRSLLFLSGMVTCISGISLHVVASWSVMPILCVSGVTGIQASPVAGKMSRFVQR